MSSYRVTRDGVEVGEVTTNGFADQDLAASTAYSYTVTALDAAGNASDPSSPLVVTTDLPPFQSDLLDPGAIWSYLDDGSDPGAGWADPSYDDSGWASGAGQLGYGDGDETTVIGWGANQWQRHITTYFRTTFEVEDAARVDQLVVKLLRDDGAVVYLNGVELTRDNMPAGPVTSATRASSAVWGSAESTYHQLMAPAAGLVTGTNTLAVELHKFASSSSDASFDLELDATELMAG